MRVGRDKHGLYIRSRWYSIDKTKPAYRPGTFNGRSHAWNTTEAGLKVGDKPFTNHIEGAPFIRIELPDGSMAYWGSHGRTEGDFIERDWR
jgi:hypothetical protein